MTLIEIITNNDYINKYKTDKESRHRYCTSYYDQIFYNLKDKKLNILEIGIKNGSSLVLWNEYFKNSIVYGIDNSDLIGNRLDNYPRIKTIIQDAYRKELTSHLPLFDIIIDDGSHLNNHIIETFKFLFPLLADNGIYVAEDLQTSYWESYGGDSFNLDRSLSAVNFFKSLVEPPVVNDQS
jgi:demethylmacrocin O-methyltransferase